MTTPPVFLHNREQAALGLTAPVMLISSAVPAGEVWFVDPVTCALVGRIINLSTEPTLQPTEGRHD